MSITKDIQQKAIDFIYLVKQRFQPSKFDIFADILVQLTTCTVGEHRRLLVSTLKNMFVNDHQDLMLALDDFLPKDSMVVDKKDESSDSDDNSKYSWLLSDSPNKFFNKIRDRCIEKNDKNFSVLITFSELMVACHDKEITVREVDSELSDLFKDDPDLYIECTMLLADLWESEMSDQIPSLDYSSVRFLNKRRKTVRRRTLFEKTMAVKEFYLYEMKMSFSRMQNTIMKLERYSESIGEGLTVHDKRCIVELYKGTDSDYSYKGEDLVEILLQSDPVRRMAARDIVLDRLRQKMSLLEEQKIRLDTVWGEIFEDIRERRAVCRHRGFYDHMKKNSKKNYF